ncbi:MAG TPA: amino acid adenylation domain-containing protein [Solirubrobacteraceae bacterium]|jgi:amino acid adenylation domain-containing protein|nr:amino acid adenylation domain-containing protein [Solirubrobacteraceae bacterium]
MSDSATDSYQSSPQQERIWTAEPQGPAARVQAVLAIEGHGSAAVAAALGGVVARHESLRTTFARQPGLTFPLQAVHAELEPRIETLNLSELEPQQLARRIEELCLSELQAPFELEHGPLVHATLVDGPGGVTHLILTLSALCADQSSTSLLLAEVLGQLAGADLVEEPLQYADFSAWQHELSESDEDEARAARAFWSELGQSDSPTLPFTLPVNEHATVEQLSLEIGATCARALAEQAARYNAPTESLVQAAWHAVLGALADSETVTVAYTPCERRHADLEGAIGAFARPVPISTAVDPSRSFAEVLAEVDRARSDALVRADYAPAGGAEEAEIGFVEFPAALPEHDGVRATLERVLNCGPQQRLLLVCGTGGERPRLSLLFDPKRHRREAVQQLAQGLELALLAAAADPSVELGTVDLLGDQERDRVLREFNETAAELPRLCVHETIAQWAQSTPEREAAIDRDGSISYGELDARANQLAQRLAALGVGPGSAVGLLAERSNEMIVGLLGILKAGGAYVPLHHEHPSARLRHQLKSAGAGVVVAQQRVLDRLGSFEGEVVCVDGDRQALEGEPSTAPASAVSSEDVAYIVYTSGSTGTPKGVAVTHGNLANYAAFILERLDAQREPMSFALVTSISTDLGNTSVFGALCSGGTLVLVDPAIAGDPGAFAELMQDTAVDVLKITPSHIRALLAAGDARALPRRWLVVGGELASWELIERVRSLGDCQILNHYGPTETTIGCCTFAVGQGRGEYAPASVPIGQPIANTSCYVLDERRRPIPVGVPGRLFVSGAGVARGYVGEPEMTAERFSEDPFANDTRRMYDTGDLVRWLPDGSLEFLGRVDEQVKLRGYRVEPAEVEAALCSLQGVREAVAVVRTDAAEPRLLAYCVTDGALQQEQLLTQLADWLPEFMLPSAIVLLDALPRTPSGKIDRLKLPEPEAEEAQSVEYVAPRTPLEEAVAAIWAQVLGLPRVGVNDEFFALGGHSLLATQVVAQVRSDFAVDLPLHSLFTSPTVATLTTEIMRMMGESEGDETAKLMAELEGMSDEEAQRLLAEDLSPEAGG